MVFEGIGFFQFRDGLIARYSEVFDRGMALAQQDFAAERIKKVLLKLADRQNARRRSIGAVEGATSGPKRSRGGLGRRLRRLPPYGKDRAVSGRDLHTLRRRAAVAQW